jgi:Uma2 family endonuclease
VAQVVLRTTLTYREYCLIPDDGKRHEILEGQHHVTAAPRPRHQDASKRIYRILFAYFEQDGRGTVYYAPIDVILSDEDVVQPDLVVVASPEQISERGIEGAPLLIVEILSPTNPDYDRSVKAQRYAVLGVRHFWLADPQARTLECYRNEGGGYVLQAMGRDRQTLILPDFPGLAIPLADLWTS